MRGAANLKSIWGLGAVVVGIFVCILLFYSNSFIMKRRKKELGVYNILGMEKRHIARVMFWENLSTMMLVMISTTVSMYVGVDDEINARYDGDVEVSLYFEDVPDAKHREV
ncbi:MAG: hypothetical protein NC307_14270 [Roseburia sp.]|nr:hypothetical protein [Roseburia sp.]